MMRRPYASPFGRMRPTKSASAPTSRTALAGVARLGPSSRRRLVTCATTVARYASEIRYSGKLRLVRASRRVDAIMRSIRSALGGGGRVSVSARQDRFHGELLPSWTLQISGTLAGSEFSIELVGPILGQLLEDAIEALVTLGIELPDELEEEPAADWTYTAVDPADDDSYPA
jgi:hypothetical protein